MQKITTCLWFDSNVEEAANFYTSLFKNSKVLGSTRYGKTGAEIAGRQEGSLMTLLFQLDGQEFLGLNGGPVFKFSPAISFFVNCKTEEEIDSLFRELSRGGMVLMDLNKYPFSEKFAWVNDKYGISWQLNLAPREQTITPCLMYVGDRHGKAEEAMHFYVSQFENSKVIKVERYTSGENGSEGTVKYALFALGGYEFRVMDSNGPHSFTFTPATSFIANCQTQQEVDARWDGLSGGGGSAGQCGWLTDRFGVSWQIVPTVLGEMMLDKDAEKSRRVMEVVLQMTKLDIKALKQAYETR